MRLPERVKVGYKTYRIEPQSEADTDNDDHLGFANHKQGLIRTQDHGPKHDCANTLLHEILHACMYVGEAGLDYDAEERAVTVTANLLIGIMQSNPEVMRWIMRNARAEE